MGRAPCCDKSGLKKGPWTPEEDHLLTSHIQTHGPGSWRTLPKKAGLQRCGKSCRLRWTNYLRPDIKRGKFSFEEEEAIIQLHSVLGNKWSAIAERLPGRTDNEIKNYWNTHIKKRLLQIGIDPVTHTRRLDLLELTSFLSGTNSSDLSLSNLFGIQQPAVTNLDLLSFWLQQIILQKLEETQNGSNPNMQANQVPSDFNPQPSQLQSTSMQALLLNNQLPAELMQQNFSCGQQYFSATPDLSGNVGSENSNVQSLDNNSNPQNFSFDSVLSTPLSSPPTPVNSLSAAFRCGVVDDERESSCRELLEFEIPESLEMAEFL